MAEEQRRKTSREVLRAYFAEQEVEPEVLRAWKELDAEPKPPASETLRRKKAATRSKKGGAK